MSEAVRPILIVAGGTGGHIYPALAVADYLRARNVPTVWLGSDRGMETQIVPRAGIRLSTIAVSGLRGRGLGRWLLAPFALSYALLQAIVALVRLRPRVVLGMGGFASGPGGVAAWLCRRPLVVHEQNAIPGLTNKLLSYIATTVLQAFPGSFLPSRHAITVGNPVRASIANIEPPAQRRLSESPLRVLVIGGSRGAVALNHTVPRAIAALEEPDLEVWHQCGAARAETTRAAYGAAVRNLKVDEFIGDMASAYSWASVVVCRAGALTVCELAAAGLAAVLVPFPFAVDDHQSANARFLADANAALIVAEGPDFEQRLVKALNKLLTDREQLVIFANNARALASPDATATVAAYCTELLHG